MYEFIAKIILLLTMNEKLYKKVIEIILILMKKLVVKKDFAFIYMNKSFYEKEIILDSIKDYNEFAAITIADLGKYFVLKISSKSNEYTPEEISNEFLNYTLAKKYEHSKEKTINGFQ